MGAPEGLMVHACNSPGVLRESDWAGNAVRPGIFLYGGEAGADLPGPEEVASLRARVVHIRDAPVGASVGYGATHRAARPERWATLAIGYGDGLPRVLSNRGHAILAGRRVPIVGRISMDVTVVDITGLPQVRCGDVATLMGSDGDESISVNEVADLAGTINYEILTGLAPRLPRVWLDDDE
jgi:alanine racemase